jgi:hypothetical protein
MTLTAREWMRRANFDRGVPSSGNTSMYNAWAIGRCAVASSVARVSARISLPNANGYDASVVADCQA